MTRTFTIKPSHVIAHGLDLENALNDAQRAAVTCGDGPKLVIAGAGSGKTRTITYRVAFLLARGLHPSQIMLATFTNKAAREMLGRVEVLTGSQSQGIWGGTFHALGNRILRQYGSCVGLSPNFSILDDGDQRDLIKVSVAESKIKVEQKRFPSPPIIQDILSFSFNTQRDLTRVIEEQTPHFSHWIEEIRKVGAGYRAKKRAANALDYDDLLRFWLQLLSDHPDIAKRLGLQFCNILVDEYQDTNIVQAQIVERLAEHNGRNLMVVGDDAQCVMEGTRILTPSGYRAVETLKRGDIVLAGAGNGRLIPEAIRVVKRSEHKRYLVIRVEGGIELRASPNHLCFAKVVYQTKWWYVYLMYRQDLGFRIGVSHISREGRKKSTAQMRTAPEKADKLWLLEAYPSRQEAQYREMVLSLRYQVPRALFRPDWQNGRKPNITREQMSSLFGEFGPNGYRLLEDYGFHFDYPSFEPKASRSEKRIAINLVMAAAKNGEGSGIHQAHELVVESSLASEVMRQFPVVRYGNGYWRLRKMNRDYRVLLDLAKTLKQRLVEGKHRASIHYKARFVSAKDFSGTFMTVPAAGLLPGLKVPVVRHGRIVSGIIESIEWKDNKDNTLFYDIEVEKSHNMVSEGIVTHNSIYRFRGANYDNILKFPERNPQTEIFKLEINYRSTPEILEFTNASILNNQNQHHKLLVAHRSGGARPVVLPVNTIFEEAIFVAERILQLREEGMKLSEMAVLYRAHAHSSVLQAELIKRNIPYEVRSGVRFFEQAHIKDVVAHLKVLENPLDEIAWRRLWLMLPRIGPATAGNLWEKISHGVNPFESAVKVDLSECVPAAARVAFSRFQKDLRQLRGMVDQSGPTELIHAVLDTPYVEYLQSNYESFQSRADDLEQLASFAKSYRTLRSFLSELILLGEVYGQEMATSGSTDDERLILSSVHQAKGLEWRVVFVLRMCEGDFPSERALREEDGEEEERRIFYVAATRSKDELYLTYPLMDINMRGNRGLLLHPSRFLREIPFTLYEHGQIENAPRGFSELN